MLYYGDNLPILRNRDYFPSGSIDLVYLDAPFNSNQDYNVRFTERDGSRSAALGLRCQIGELVQRRADRTAYQTSGPYLHGSDDRQGPRLVQRKTIGLPFTGTHAP